ncbi:hypothetical protein [Kibdelosporangium philippinense]|uniref:hypothetical protein n=1 Tax=Kibdelosporangium philippinense TaxID=211113 RepID=UPI00360F51A8
MRTDPDRVTARVSNAITPLDRAAASLTVGPDPRMYAALLVERANELSIAGQADAVGVQLARLVRKFTGTLPEVEPRTLPRPSDGRQSVTAKPTSRTSATSSQPSTTQAQGSMRTRNASMACWPPHTNRTRRPHQVSPR